jgi:hypothetical protein
MPNPFADVNLSRNEMVNHQTRIYYIIIKIIFISTRFIEKALEAPR